MKILTVLAAALAAGLTTFAANAQEEGAHGRFHEVSVKPDRRRVAERVKDDQESRRPRRGCASATERPDGGRGVCTPRRLNEAGTAATSPIIERYASLQRRPGVARACRHPVESNYRPNARGSAGEVGLMQIKPATAR